MKKHLLTLAFLLAAIVAQAQVASTFYAKADAFFRKNVTNGLVNYKGIKAEPTELDGLVAAIASQSTGGMDRNTSKAFYLNAYNILVIKNVVDHYPIAKPTDVPGFFDQITFKVAGAATTLSDLENKKIRGVYKDPRVHFALVCAAKSCPPIANFAFSGANVEDKLNVLTKAALNSPNFIKVDNPARKAHLSQIMDWYKDDFIAHSKGVVLYINKYRTNPIPDNFTIDYYPYNWDLNEKR